ncbi:MAG: putative transposase, partial [Thermococcaceae archaeon]|nr:putative transposase [Thermococcaceae archaeon]
FPVSVFRVVFADYRIDFGFYDQDFLLKVHNNHQPIKRLKCLQMATSIYKSYRKRKRRGKANGKPVFKKEVIMLDDHLFKPDLEKGVIKLSTPKGRIQLEFYPAKYHEKFKDWKVGQAWLIKTPKGAFINAVFSKEVEVREPKAFVGVDLNENNVTLALPNGEFVQIITHEREIRTGYFVKRRKIQKKLKTGKRRRELLEKYGEKERNRLNDLYHKLANKIVELAVKYGGIALEDLTEIRDSIRYSAEMNGRLHRWSFRRLQSIIEYKAKLKGIKVVFVNPAFTSSLCPICGGKPPESQPMKTGGWKPTRYEINTLHTLYG